MRVKLEAYAQGEPVRKPDEKKPKENKSEQGAAEPVKA